MSVKNWAILFGVVFVVVGILGFVPGITSNGQLLGLFEVDATHNVIHLLSGVIALLAVMGTAQYASLYFKVFGVIYAIVTVAGFVQGDTVLGLISVDLADNVLHLVIAALALWIGFGMKDEGAMAQGQGM